MDIETRIAVRFELHELAENLKIDVEVGKKLKDDYVRDNNQELAAWYAGHTAQAQTTLNRVNTALKKYKE